MSIITNVMSWVDDRLPVTKTYEGHLSKYYGAKNVNFMYFFGFLAFIVLANQLLTGIWLTMMYNPSSEGAFDSVEYIMRDVEWGWLIRYMHSTGASAFFIVIYMHMLRALMYGSAKKPRELVWVFGMVIFFLLILEAFLGYVLVWGNMSYWAAQVIVALPGAIPFIGEDIAQWIRGDYLISGVTLNRFFAFHVILMPLLIIVLTFLHIVALHEVGSNNPDGIDIKKHTDEYGVPLDGVPFFPHQVIHDLWAGVIFFFVFAAVILYFPDGGGYFIEAPNFEPANALKTPEHIVPVWYFTPFYAILRAIPDKLGGFIAMGAAVIILFAVPWLDRSPARSLRYRGIINKLMLIIFCIAFVLLGICGVKNPNLNVEPLHAIGIDMNYTVLGQICTVIYFGYFITMPFWSAMEPTKPVPDRVPSNH